MFDQKALIRFDRFPDNIEADGIFKIGTWFARRFFLGGYFQTLLNVPCSYFRALSLRCLSGLEGKTKAYSGTLSRRNFWRLCAI